MMRYLATMKTFPLTVLVLALAPLAACHHSPKKEDPAAVAPSGNPGIEKAVASLVPGESSPESLKLFAGAPAEVKTVDGAEVYRYTETIQGQGAKVDVMFVHVNSKKTITRNHLFRFKAGKYLDHWTTEG